MSRDMLAFIESREFAVILPLNIFTKLTFNENKAI